MTIDPTDIEDSGFVSEDELISDGTFSYRIETIVSITSGTISFAANTALEGYDDPVQTGDTVVIAGNAAAGTYTVDTVNLDDFTVVEAIVDAAGGTADFRHPAGATNVGVDPTNVAYSAENTLQDVLEDVPGVPPTEIGQLMMSIDGATWSAVKPLVSGDDGWLSNCDADLLVEGLL